MPTIETFFPSPSFNLPVTCLYNSFSAGTLKCSIREMRAVKIVIGLLDRFSHPVKSCKIVCAKIFPAHPGKKTLCSENDY